MVSAAPDRGVSSRGVHGWVACFAIAAVLLAGCASIPGKTRQEQIETMDGFVKRTLADLEKQHPNAKAELDSSVGYVMMSNKIVKIPLVGGGSGYGVGIDEATNEQTYLIMRRFDLGMGWGARSVRPVLIFHDRKKFGDFIDGMFEGKIGAEASAKVGEAGAAGGGGGAGAPAKDLGYTSYLITDSGVSATASVGVIRVKRVNLKKK